MNSYYREIMTKSNAQQINKFQPFIIRMYT